MTNEELELIRKLGNNEATPTIFSNNYTTGTLLYGYTCNRDNFHVYKGKDGLIHVYRYGEKNIYMCKENWKAEWLVPDKRVYPAASNFGFIRDLINLDVYVPFTTFHENQVTGVVDGWYIEAQIFKDD